MRFSEAWLREWVSPDVDSAALAEQLAYRGSGACAHGTK